MGLGRILLQNYLQDKQTEKANQMAAQRATRASEIFDQYFSGNGTPGMATPGQAIERPGMEPESVPLLGQTARPSEMLADVQTGTGLFNTGRVTPGNMLGFYGDLLGVPGYEQYAMQGMNNYINQGYGQNQHQATLDQNQSQFDAGLDFEQNVKMPFDRQTQMMKQQSANNNAITRAIMDRVAEKEQRAKDLLDFGGFDNPGTFHKERNAVADKIYSQNQPELDAYANAASFDNLVQQANGFDLDPVAQGAAMINFYKIFKPGEALNVDDVTQIENTTGIPGFARDAIRAAKEGKLVGAETIKKMYEAANARMRVIDEQLKSKRQRQQSTMNPAFLNGGSMFTQEAERNIFTPPQAQQQSQYQAGQRVRLKSGGYGIVQGIDAQGGIIIKPERAPGANNTPTRRQRTNNISGGGAL